jgi:hypothetical protein
MSDVRVHLHPKLSPLYDLSGFRRVGNSQSRYCEGQDEIRQILKSVGLRAPILTKMLGRPSMEIAIGSNLGGGLARRGPVLGDARRGRSIFA